MIRLTVRHQSQPGAEEVIESDKPVVTLGRHSENDVVLGERTVSRKHAQIELDGSRYVLRDLGSHFGVFVNKRKVEVEELAPGSEIYITPFIIRFDLLSMPAPAAPSEVDLTLGPDVGSFPARPAPAAPPPPEPEPALMDDLVEIPAAPVPDDHIAGLPGLDARPDRAAFEEPPAMGGGEPVPADDGGTLMSWGGSAEQAHESPEPAPPPFEVDEAPPQALPPAPAPAPAPRKPVLTDETPVQHEEYKPWDKAAKADQEEEEEEDVLEEVRPESRTRKDLGPLPVEEKNRKADLLACRGYGRFRVLLMGFMMLVLPFFPLAAEKGRVYFFWDLFGKQGAEAGIATYLGAAGLGFFLLVFSIFGSGLVRGFLQALFAGAFLGVVTGVFLKFKIPIGTGQADLAAIFGNYLMLLAVCGFFLSMVTMRVKLFHPRKIFSRLFGLLAAGAIAAAFFVPPSALKLDGTSMFNGLIEAFKAPSKPWFLIVNLCLLALIALVCLTNVIGWRSSLRSRLALLAGFYLMLHPIIIFIVDVAPKLDDADLIPLVSAVRNFMLMFLALWAFLVGASAFIGNFLVAMNYNEKMLLAED